MFVSYFVSETSGFFYIYLLALAVICLLLIRVKTIVGPVALALVYLVFSVAWGLDFVNSSDAVWLIIYFFVVVLSINFGSRIKIRKRFLYMGRGEYRFTVLIYFLSLLAFLAFVLLLRLLFSSYGYTKLTWTVDFRLLSYLASFFEAVLLSLSLYLVLKKKFHYLFLSAAVLGVYGLVIGSKSVLISIAIVYAVGYVSSIYKAGWKELVFSKLAMYVGFIVILISYVYFGFENSASHFISRVAATVDGLFILKTSGLYGDYRLPDSVWLYVFDFAASKFFGARESIGQILASESLYIAYPPSGGPNDSMVLYLLFSDSYNKLFLIIFAALFSFIFGILDSFFKGGRGFITVIGVVALAPLYLGFAGFYQGVGTFFILLSRSYVYLIPFLIVLSLFVGVGLNEREAKSSVLRSR